MKKEIFARCIVLMCLTGCISTEQAAKHAHQDGALRAAGTSMHVSNYGYFLFNSIPIVSGDAQAPGEVAWFQDDVTLEHVQRVLVNQADQQKTALIDIAPTLSSTCWLGFPTFGLVWYKEVQVSGVIVNPKKQVTP